jgi:hypothetical protein
MATVDFDAPARAGGVTPALPDEPVRPLRGDQSWTQRASTA